MIPATAKPDCTACAKSGGTYDMHCRECVGRWLRFLNARKAGRYGVDEIVLLQETKRMLQVAA